MEVHFPRMHLIPFINSYQHWSVYIVRFMVNLLIHTTPSITTIVTDTEPHAGSANQRCMCHECIYQLLVTTVMGSGLSLIVCVINQLVKCYFGQGRVEWQYINVGDCYH